MADADPTIPPAPAGEAQPPAAEQAPAQGQQQAEQTIPYARFKQVNDQLASLREQLQALTGEKEQAGQAAQTLEQRLAAIERERDTERAAHQRLQVATAKKLPAELAERLQGSTPEELAQDADRLLALLKPIVDGPGIPPSGGGRPAAKFDMAGKTPAEIREAHRKGLI